MGCDIHPYVEVRQNGKWEWEAFAEPPFDWRSYGMFGFLANIRNYSEVPTIVEPRGLPDDVSCCVKKHYGSDEDCYDWHSASWVTLKELLDFNYSQMFWDRRITKQMGPRSWNGAARAEEGEGEHLTIREFLGKQFFECLSQLGYLGAPPEDVRVVFWFDN